MRCHVSCAWIKHFTVQLGFSMKWMDFVSRFTFEINYKATCCRCGLEDSLSMICTHHRQRNTVLHSQNTLLQAVTHRKDKVTSFPGQEEKLDNDLIRQNRTSAVRASARSRLFQPITQGFRASGMWPDLHSINVTSLGRSSCTSG